MGNWIHESRLQKRGTGGDNSLTNSSERHETGPSNRVSTDREGERPGTELWGTPPSGGTPQAREQEWAMGMEEGPG